MSEVINAFHPKYMETYHPNFWNGLQHNASISEKTTKAVDKLRKAKPSHGTMMGMTKKVINLKPTDFLVYSRAGTKNVTPKGKK